MGNLWLRIRIWTKVGFIAAVVLYVILFTYNNAQPKVELWYWFGHKPQTNLLLLALCSFLAGVVVTILARATLRTVRQVQDLQDRARAQKMGRDMADIRAKAAMLQTRTTPIASATPDAPVSPAPPPPAPTRPAPAPARPAPAPIERLEDRTQM